MDDQMRSDPLYHPMVAADIKGSANRSDQIQVMLHEALYRVVPDALRHASVPDGDCTLVDRGDGVLVVFQPNVSIRPLIDPMMPRLVAGLESYNAAVGERERMQLRVALHSGYVRQDAMGYYTGQALIHLFRLLDSRLLRSRLAASSAPLVLIVSETVYDAVVRQHDGIDPSAYELVRVTNKEVKGARAWIWAPGRGGAAPLPSPAAMRERISNLPPPNPNFTGRDELLQKIRQSFTGEPPDDRARPSAAVGGRKQRWVQALHGLAGVGKSQLARE